MRDPRAWAPQHPPAERDVSVLRSRLWRRLGLDSIRGRYLLAMGLFVAFILASGWIAQTLVDRSESQSVQNTGEREEVARLLNRLSDDIWLAETSLQGYLLSLDKQERQTAAAAFDHLAADTHALSTMPWARLNESRQERLELIAKQIVSLRTQSEHLMAVRVDAEKMFPAMRFMITRMLPNHETFISFASLAMDEAEQHPNLPHQDEIYKIFSQMRYAWVLKIGAFRMFVATRFGVFPGEPERGMKSQHEQIMFYQEMVDRLLDRLAVLASNKVLEFQQLESFERMRKINREWLGGYQHAAAIYNSERWRLDVPLLRDTIRPLFAQIWLNLSVLRGELESGSTSDMTALANTADRLSGTLWLILIITVGVTGIGYLFFEHTVRRPIAAVAAALKAEAVGSPDVMPGNASTFEVRDLVSAFDHMRAQVHTRQLRLQTILDNTAEGILTFDANGIIESFNHAAERLFGWSESEVVGQGISLLTRHEGEVAIGNSFLARILRGEFESLLDREGELTGWRKSGDSFPMEIKIGGMNLEGRRLYTALVADNSERKAMIEHLRELAEHDDLTGLYNRKFFLHELERVVERARRGSHSCTLLYIDLDNFKYVNDTLGHQAGDRLLLEVSQLLRKRARRGDLVARLGGDEFTILLYDTRFEETYALAEVFRRSLAEYRFRHGAEQVHLGCSIGAAMISASPRTAQEILSRADFACHLAKRDGRNRVHVFEDRDEENVAALSLDMGWTRRIKDAIDQDRLVLVRQPILATRNLQVATYEILVRMLDESNNIIMPSGFLAIAERFGLATDIDRWVIANAMEALARHRQSLPDVRYIINLSGQTLSQPDVADFIVDELRRIALAPAALIFEVTETAAITDMPIAVTFLNRLKTMGCATSLDDFGSGMSSFAYLRELPVDYVKIDGRFVRHMTDNVMDQAMVRAMNDIAHALGKTTVAEFVETEACLKMLVQYGVDYVQGFFFGEPEIIPEFSRADRSPRKDKVVYLRPQ